MNYEPLVGCKAWIFEWLCVWFTYAQIVCVTAIKQTMTDIQIDEAYYKKKRVKEKCLKIESMYFLIFTVHTESFDWFRSGLEWILNLEFCLLKLLTFYQKILWNIRSRLNSSTFEFLSLYLIKIFIFCAQSFNFDQTSKYRPKISKCGRVKPRSDIP